MDQGQIGQGKVWAREPQVGGKAQGNQAFVYTVCVYELQECPSLLLHSQPADVQYHLKQTRPTHRLPTHSNPQPQLRAATACNNLDIPYLIWYMIYLNRLCPTLTTLAPPSLFLPLFFFCLTRDGDLVAWLGCVHIVVKAVHEQGAGGLSLWHSGGVLLHLHHLGAAAAAAVQGGTNKV